VLSFVFSDRGVEISAGDVDVLTNLQHHDGDAGVLTQGHHLRSRNFGVFQNLIEDDYAKRR
jgi:hypothetical protein